MRDPLRAPIRKVGTGNAPERESHHRIRTLGTDNLVETGRDDVGQHSDGAREVGVIEKSRRGGGIPEPREVGREDPIVID